MAKVTDDQLTQLAGRIKGRGQGVNGDLVVTSLVSAAPVLAPILTRFQIANPGLRVRFLTGDRLFRLEYGEAHVAIRAGVAPDQPDNVVQPFLTQAVRLVASPDYIARMGMPTDTADLAGHEFVGHDDDQSRAPRNKTSIMRLTSMRVVGQTVGQQTRQLRKLFSLNVLGEINGSP